MATASRGGDRDTLDEGQPDEQESEQRDDHGDAGEHHGAAAGVDRGHHRVLDAGAAFEILSVAGDDEQRVVDADAQADHRHHRGGEVGHRDDVAGERHERRGDAEAEQGDADRQAHGEDRTERQDEDDDRRDDAVDLALGELELGEQVAAVLDLEPLDRVELVALLDDVVTDLVEFGERPGVGDVDLGEGDRAVLAHLLRAVVGRGDGDVVDLRRRRRTVPPSSPAPRDRSTPCGALEHDLRREAGSLGRVRLEQFLHLLRLAGRKREVGAVVGADGTGHAVDRRPTVRPTHRSRSSDGGRRRGPAAPACSVGSRLSGGVCRIRRSGVSPRGSVHSRPTMFARGCDGAHGTLSRPARIDATAVSVSAGPRFIRRSTRSRNRARSSGLTCRCRTSRSRSSGRADDTSPAGCA